MSEIGSAVGGRKRASERARKKRSGDGTLKQIPLSGLRKYIHGALIESLFFNAVSCLAAAADGFPLVYLSGIL